MKVAQLIAMLEGEDQDADVHFAYNYGDHWRTEVAPKVSNVTVGIVEFSDYHRMDKLVTDEDEVYDEDTGDYKEDVRKVVVLA
jgi:hypothetical protein